MVWNRARRTIPPAIWKITIPYQEVRDWFDPALYQPGGPLWVTGDGDVNDNGTSAADLTITVPWIPKAVCDAINRRTLGAAYSGTPPPLVAGTLAGANQFQGVYGPDRQEYFPAGSPLIGLGTGCFYDPSSQYYTFFYVLIAR